MTRKIDHALVRQQRWNREFEAAVLASRPELAGRIDWANTAFYYYNSGFSPAEAAERQLAAAVVRAA